jgi:AcrR family transcriptional regulator
MRSIPTENRRERKKQDTRQKIVKIAMYFFRKQGFDSTTMEQIAEEVDISKATLYNYFPVKESIIGDYWQSNIKEFKLQILEMIQLLPDTRTRVQRTFTKAAAELFKSKEDIYKIYLSYWLRNLNNQSVNERLRSGFEDIFTMIIKLGHHAGDIRKDMSVELLVKYLEILFLTVCINWLSDPKLFPLEATLVQTVSLFIEGAGSGSRKSKTKVDGEESAQGKLL